MPQLIELIEKLELSEDKGVLFIKKFKLWTNAGNEFSNEICNKLDKISPDAVYHYLNQPFILFFDRTVGKTKFLKSERLIFKEVWSWDKVPIVFFIYEDDLKVFNAFHYQRKLDDQNDTLELIDRSKNEIYEQFSFWNLQSGNTWRWLEENFYTKKQRSGKRTNIISQQRVNQKLFDHIRYAREQMSEDLFNPVLPELANLVLLRLIFIRYLIDRGVLIDEHFISGNSVEEKKQCFNGLIANKNKLYDFFAYLKTRFNGNLFDTSNDDEIDAKHFSFLSDFFSDNLKNKNQLQLFYFDVFDFSVIPVEVISGIYESVIDDAKRKNNSAVYTPSFLVDYVLEQTVDPFLNSVTKADCKVLDPSCGSGIFLTQIYRRLVEKEIKLHGSVSDERLKEIANQNIFGIDRDLNALHVAAFSIYIALLDYKQPPEIKVFHLPELLGRNLFRNDFFNETKEDLNDAIVTHYFDERFRNEIALDFILGNPPWGSKNDKIRDKYHLQYIEKNKLPIARAEIAQTFLIRANDFRKTKNGETHCSFIITSKAFYNLWAKAFKKMFFTTNFVEEIFDMSASRRLLFEGAINPALIIRYRHAEDRAVENNQVKHIALKPNRLLINYRILSIEKPDRKTIFQKHFINYGWMLKFALYGSSMDFMLLSKLNEYKDTLKAYIDNIPEVHVGDGIKLLTENAKSKLSTEAQNKLNSFAEISSIPIIETDDINPFYSILNPKNLPTDKDKLVKSGRNINLYRGKHILIKARPFSETDLAISFVDSNSVYREKTLGISSSVRIDSLTTIYGIVISKLYTHFQYLVANSWGIFMPEIMQEEYLSFPYIEIKEKEYFIEQVEKFIYRYKEYYTSFPRSPEPPNPEHLSEFNEINRIVNETYGITPIEEDLIDYVLQVSRYEFQESKLQKFLRPPLKDELLKYAQLFYHYFSNVYDNDKQYFKIEVYTMNTLVAMKFILSTEKTDLENQISFLIDKDEKALFKIIASNLSIYNLSSQIFTQKDIIGSEPGYFYIVKPNQYKSWHIARAHHDLTTIRQCIMKAENELNGQVV